MDSHRPTPPDGDTLTRFMFEHAEVRGESVRLDATWRAVLARHHYPEPVRNLLGEMMAACALLAATLKFEGALIMQMQGSGPVTLLVVECDSEFHLRATAKWRDDLADEDVRALLGDGKFVITIDPKTGGQAYQSIVALEGATVSEVLGHYMLRSEQLETRLWLAADEHQACGLLLQRLPEKTSDDEDAWNRALNLAGTLTPDELLSLPAREVLHRLFHEEDLRLFDPQPVSFRCTCSRDRVTAMLRMLGLDEVRSILSEQGRIDVDCEFCNQHYSFDPVDAEQIFAAEVLTQAGTTRH
ncbi:MAG: molecular chaperone Hsp33 [Betaproteobacteria bacterium RBG_16_58_11]|nr:MAG: molecular chaperone Hsp33 [Betaproteobacteria bacterium RBG_16_58_11]